MKTRTKPSALPTIVLAYPWNSHQVKYAVWWKLVQGKTWRHATGINNYDL